MYILNNLELIGLRDFKDNKLKLHGLGDTKDFCLRSIYISSTCVNKQLRIAPNFSRTYSTLLYAHFLCEHFLD